MKLKNQNQLWFQQKNQLKLMIRQTQNFNNIKYQNIVEYQNQQYFIGQIQQKIQKNRKKITINQFLQQTKQSDEPQMKLLEKVENPYNFASNVNTEGFIKKYYSNQIRIGLVKPPLRIAPQNQEAIQRSRVISAMKLIEHTHNQLKPKRETSAAYGNTDPLLSINASVQTNESEINMSTQKLLEKNKTMTTYYPTPRTHSQPQLDIHLQYEHPNVKRHNLDQQWQNHHNKYLDHILDSWIILQVIQIIRKKFKVQEAKSTFF